MGTIRKNRRLNETQEIELIEKRLYLLEIFKEIADRHGVKWYLNWGTLLGLVRDNGKFLPHDNDVDISIYPETLTLDFYNEYMNHPEIISSWGGSLEFKRYLVGKIDSVPYSIGLQSNLCTHGRNKKNNLNLIKVGSVGVWLDLNLAFEWNGYTLCKWKGKFFKFPRVDELQTVKFYGMDVYIPTDSEKHLVNIYTKDWNVRMLNWGTTKYGPEYWLTEEETDEVNNMRFKWEQ